MDRAKYEMHFEELQDRYHGRMAENVAAMQGICHLSQDLGSSDHHEAWRCIVVGCLTFIPWFSCEQSHALQ